MRRIVDGDQQLRLRMMVVSNTIQSCAFARLDRFKVHAAYTMVGHAPGTAKRTRAFAIGKTTITTQSAR